MVGLQFTRYLYAKDEVKLSLLTSILTKNTEEAIFWAYELFYSGLGSELSDLLWSIYYDFYAGLNPSFVKYLTKKIKCKFKKGTGEERDVAMVINNFIIRPYTLDVFFMRIFTKQYKLDKYIGYKSDFSSTVQELHIFLENRDYISLSSFILYYVKSEDLLKTLELFILFFKGKILHFDDTKHMREYNKILLNSPYKRVVLLANLLNLYYLLGNKPLGKNSYIHVDPEDVIMYETIYVDLKEKGNGSRRPILAAYKILPMAVLYPIDEHHYLSLFKLQRDSHDIKTAYYNWLYYASFSPVWKDRIKKYTGVIDMETQSVLFPNEDIGETFYENFNYEPDEQTLEVQNHTIKIIETKRSWLSFYKDHNKNSIIELDEKMLIELDKLEY